MKKNHTLVELEEIAQSDEKFKKYFEETINVPAEKYFNGDKFAIDVFNAKYAIDWGDYKETPGQVFWRLATEVDKIEDLLETPKNLREFFKRMVYLLLYEGWFRPGGSIISGLRPDAGKRKISLFNCTTVPLEEDSLEGIFKCVYSVAKCAAYRQGIGVDVSKLRPSGTPIANAAEVSDGPVHWMDFIQQLGNYVGQKGRHLALLLSLKVDHPDIEQFLVAKSDLNKINNANISVQIDDHFMKAVLEDKDYVLSFNVPEHSIKVERKVSARELFRKLAEQAINYAEPGIQYIGPLFSGKMCYYLGNYLGKEELIPISTNACSEQPLAPYSVCNLLSINMAKFNPSNFKYELNIIAPIIVRFLDDCIIYEIVNDLSPLPQQREIVSKLKEIGCGITNLHLWLLKQGIDYDSDEAIGKVDDFMAHYTASVVMASSYLGKERGKAPILKELSFEEFKEAIKDWHLYKNLSGKFPSVKWDKVLYNCANTSFMSIAPTGSISTSFPEPCFSSGVEPVIGWYYWRKTRAVEKGKYIYYFVIPEPVKRFILQKIDPNYEDYKILSNFPGSVRDDDGKIGAKYVEIIKKYIGDDTCKPAHLIDPFKKVELMSRIYKWLDASISCTFNLPETADTDLVYDLFLDAYKKGVRAVTVYREGSRDAVLIFNPPPVYERKFLLKQSLCVKRPDDIAYHCAPKRPKDLSCDIHQIMVKGKRWVVLVGLLNGKPYEVFAGEYDPDVMYIPKSQTEGIIRKEGKGKYSLIVKVRGSEIEYKDIAQLFMNEEQRSLTRLISLALRHGVPIEFIVDQLKKSIKDITEFSSGVARVLSKYVVVPINGNKKCHNCGKENSLILNDGCYICLDCGYSKCA